MPPKSAVAKFAVITRRMQRQTLCQRGCIITPQTTPSFQARCISASTAKYEEMEVDREDRPRWQSTPPNMTAPVRSRPKPLNNEFRVNEDPRRLDQAYTQMLGSGGDKMLTEEVKWLAVTHKSFDHGRRGFNDRLAFLGKRLVEVQTSLAIIHSASGRPSPLPADLYERVPFQHPALDGLPSLTAEARTLTMDKRRLSQLAQQYGLGSVVRWKPKKADNLAGSGMDMVLAQALYAIVGAVALQRGGETAIKMVQERILHPLGLS